MSEQNVQSDRLTRFLLERSGVRGVLVQLDLTWRSILERNHYPAAVAERLGEACAAAALFTGHAKVEGRLSVQLRGTGALRTLFAECTSAGTLRGIARYAEPLPEPLTPRAFGEGSILAITIETLAPGAKEKQRYQGLVGLAADHLAQAFEDYFGQSEQLPTRLLLAADQQRAAGLMLQQLPEVSGDDDGWARNSALFDTLGSTELLTQPGEVLLWRLFHEEGVRLLRQAPLSFACSCSRARVEDVLRQLGAEDAQASVRDGQTEVNCDFCGQTYHFSPEQIADLFASPGANAPSSTRLQ